MASLSLDLLVLRASGRVDPGEFGAGDRSVSVCLGSQAKFPLEWKGSLADLDTELYLLSI